MHNVLIADDSKAMRLEVMRAVREVLPQASIDYASSGAEVLRAWRSDTPPDLMILDIHMPVLNGLEVLRHMATEDAGHPTVVIYTASRDDVMREQCLQAGAAAIVTKSHEDIYEAIRNALQLSPIGT